MVWIQVHIDPYESVATLTVSSLRPPQSINHCHHNSSHGSGRTVALPLLVWKKMLSSLILFKPFRVIIVWNHCEGL